MKKIDKGYAIIYIDDENEFHNILKYSNINSLKEDIESYFDTVLSSDFYSSPQNYLQWNFYVMVSSDGLSDEAIKIVRENDKYARIVFMNLSHYCTIENQIAGEFPDYNPSKIKQVNLVVRDSKYEANRFVFSEMNKSTEVGYIRDSFLLDYNEMTTIQMLDEDRILLLLGTCKTYTYYTHISWEASIFKKKFGFLGDKLKLF